MNNGSHWFSLQKKALAQTFDAVTENLGSAFKTTMKKSATPKSIAKAKMFVQLALMTPQTLDATEFGGSVSKVRTGNFTFDLGIKGPLPDSLFFQVRLYIKMIVFGHY